MNWLLLLLAGLCEVGWAVGLKYTNGFTRLWPSLGTALSMLFSVVLLGLAVRHLPLGTAYAVWNGHIRNFCFRRACISFASVLPRTDCRGYSGAEVWLFLIFEDCLRSCGATKERAVSAAPTRQ